MIPGDGCKPTDAVRQVSPVELKTRLNAGEPITLLDVREPAERAFCAISAPEPALDLFVPMREIPTRLGEIRSALAAPSGRVLVVYCHHGVRSMAVAEWLVAQGFSSVQNLTDGIDAWSLQADASVRRYH